MGGAMRVRYLTTRVRHLMSTGMEGAVGYNGRSIQGRPTIILLVLEAVRNEWGDEERAKEDLSMEDKLNSFQWFWSHEQYGC